LNSKTLIHVLHVDDDESFLRVSQRILSATGPFKVRTANSVNEALKKIQHSPFDVVISDYEMPLINGLEFLKTLRQSGSTLPFVLFTGKGREEIAVQALNLGADGYVNKYGDPETVYAELANCIRHLYEKAQAQRLLWESEERFKRMVINSKDLIMLTANDGKIIYLSPACKTILGYAPEELIGTVTWLIHPDDIERVKKVFSASLKNPTIGNVEYRIVTKQGEIRWVDHSYSQIMEHGKLTQAVSTLRDITESKNAEAKLRQSEERFRLAVQNIPIMMATLNGNLEYTWLYNARLNMPDSAFLGKRFGEVLKIQDVEQLRSALVDLLQTGGSFRREVIVHLEGGSLVFDTYFEASHNEKGEVNGVRFATYDVTDRKKTEQKLQESQEQCRFIAENALDVLTVTDVNGTFLYVSPSVKPILGFTPEELMDKKSILQFLPSAEISRLNPKMQQLRETGQVEPIEISLQTKTGKTVCLESKISRVRDPSGNISFITISRDITERKRYQAERDQALNQAELLLEKLRVVNGFVQHDIRNKLAIITNWLFLSKKYANNNQNMLSQIDQITSVTEGIVRILEFAQTISSVGDRGLSWVPVYGAVKKAQELFTDLGGVDFVTSNLDFEVQADVALIEIFHNLIDNSLKYGKNLTLIKIYAEHSDGDLRLIYEDNGGGIDTETKGNLFQKGAGKGTGLGLYLIQRICDIYGWTINEEGISGVGVRFVLSIPQKQTKPA
jgi:PAS domain S-box-containing protein